MEEAQEPNYAGSPIRSDATMDSCGQKRPAPDGDDLRSQQGDSKRLAPTPPVTYRLLCPSARTGSVIGKKGDVIQQLRQETGSKIKIEEAVPNCDERVILITAPDCPGADWSPAQEALFRVHSRMVEGDSDNTDLQGLNITVRLLVDGSQIGCVLGKGGTIITELRAQTGANIRILGKKERPLCALESDELVQINGDPSKVRDALTRISAQLRANPAKHKPSAGRKIAVLSANATAFNNAAGGLPGGTPVISLVADSSMLGMMAPHVIPASLMQRASIETVYRLLVPQAHTGGIIGRKGEVVRQIREQTGALVKVQAGTVGCEERVVQLSSVEDPVSQFCNATEGLLRCAECALRDQRDAAHQIIRFLVPSPHASLLLGPANSQALADLRIGCQVQVSSPPLLAPLPKGCESGDQVVQLAGPLSACLPAIQRVVQLLRSFQMRDHETMRVPTSAHLGLNPELQRRSSPDVLPQSRPQSRQGEPSMAAQHGSQHAQQGQAGGPAAPSGLPMMSNHGISYLPGELRLGFMPGPPGQAHSQPGLAMSGPMPMQMGYIPNGGIPMPASQHMMVHPPHAGPRSMGYSQADMPHQDMPHDCHMHGASPEPPAHGPGFCQGPMHPLPSLNFHSAPMQAAHGMGGAGMADGMHQAFTAPMPTFGLAPLDMGGSFMPMPVLTSHTNGITSQQRQQAPPRNESRAPPIRSAGQPSQRGERMRGNKALIAGPAEMHGVAPAGHMVQIVLMPMQVGCVLGKGGANIAQIRQISSARVKIHPATDPSGSRDMEICGTPEQCQAAQNLVQAFLLAGGAPPLSPMQAQAFFH